ncbi:CDKL2_4 [Blepharisma stoltei]|uniref:Cyclin-dependent kinase 2 homolog n=1 Tax=Blepharisma stoltei TaxID=1481888 RepID=A0AAU9JHB4_9CILI|nr:unnamed protein product [Blepharisma stoltei]
MEKYQLLEVIGEGTYGTVYKAKHKDLNAVFAIKKFKETEDNESVRKTAMREINMLKLLKYDNIVNLFEVFRKNKKIYLVFEYVERTVLNDLENSPQGISPFQTKKIMYQLLRAIKFCHDNNIVHRDIKPENLLISNNGVLKICDFGFARGLNSLNGQYTDYVSTRWYRAPELLVGDTEYGKPVDIWAMGCILAELLTGLPLFPGDSDIDTLSLIMKLFGEDLTEKQINAFKRNPMYYGEEAIVPIS